MANFKMNAFFILLTILALPQLGQAGITLQNCAFNNVNYLCAKNVKYGPDKLNSLDVWIPKYRGEKLSLVVYIHGGGYYQGDKNSVYNRGPLNPETIVKSGMAFATINYRLSGDNPFLKGVTGEFPAEMSDSAAALQFLRANSSSIGVDKTKVILAGTSAGGGISTWLTLHDDLAQPKSSIPMKRESTRVKCTVLMDTQPTVNIPEVTELLTPYGFELDEGLPGLYGTTVDQYLSMSEYYDVILKDSYAEASGMTHLSADDDAIFMLTYLKDLESGNIHSPELGIYFATGKPYALKRKYGRKSLAEMGLDYELHYGLTHQETQDYVLRFIKQNCPQAF